MIKIICIYLYFKTTICINHIILFKYSIFNGKFSINLNKTILGIAKDALFKEEKNMAQEKGLFGNSWATNYP